MSGGPLECLHSFPLEGNLLTSVGVSPGGLACVSSSLSGELQCWDVARPREVQSWTYAHLGHSEPIRALVMLGERVMVSASTDRSIRVARVNLAAGDAAAAEEEDGAGYDAWSAFGLGRLERDGEGLPGAPPPASASPRRASPSRPSVEDVLRGVEDAADELVDDWPDTL